jgi:two-component system, NarL family, sensor histidine kinase DesK
MARMIAGTGTVAGMGGNASGRATAFPVAVLCLLLVARVSDVFTTGQGGQVPFTVALFIAPLLYAFPGTRPLIARHRWLVLMVQGVLTWAPFALFGDRWQVGIGGLLAGLVLLTVASPLSWLLAGGLLGAEVLVRVTLTGLPIPLAWFAVLYVVTYYIDDALAFFGLVRLAQLVGDTQEARGRSEDLAAAGERLQAAGALQAAIGERLAGIAAMAASARHALPHDPAQARAQIAAAGGAARQAVAQARAVTTAHRNPPHPEPAGLSATGAVVGARLAWTVLVTVLLMFAAESLGYVIISRYGARLIALAAADIVLVAALQIYHSRGARDGGRPRAWPLTLALQAMLVYAAFLPFVAAYVGVLAPFLAGSILLLVPGRWRWAGYAAVVASWSVLSTTLVLRGLSFAAGQRVAATLLSAALVAGIGLMVYGLSRLAGVARQLEALRGELARMAVMQERLRVARDVHDLLGLGLSAIALKSDLIGRLIGRDYTSAAAEIEEMSRVCAAARADLRLVTAGRRRLSLAAELGAARQILASAGIEVRASIPEAALPGAADDVVATVLREAVTNILRHSAATACTIDAAAEDGALRLRVSNDGVPERAAADSGAGQAAADHRTGSGLANLTARVHAAGGRLASRQADGRFDLIAEIPLNAPPG